LNAHRSAQNDSLAKIVSFEANTNFSRVVDSTTVPLKNSNLPYIFTSGKDYKIITLPSNTQHTVKRLSFGNEKGNGSTGKDGDRCNSSVNMVVDDSLFHYNMQDMNGGTGYVYLFLL
jgi:hypothetical protein